MAPLGLRIPIQLTTILFFMGSALLLFFIILAGSQDHGILQKWYWLEADTSSLQNAKWPVTRWSMYGICGYEKGSSLDKVGKFIACTKNKADYPLDLRRNFGISMTDVWEDFQSDKFYYMTRFQFPFYLISLFFVVIAMFASAATSCSRVLSIVTSAFSLLAFLFSAIAASLSTAAYVEGRNVFKNNGADAKIAPTLYGFAWAVVVMTFINTIFSCMTMPSKTGAPGTGYKTKKSKGTPKGKRGGYKFGISKKKTVDGTADNKDASSFVRA